MSARSIELARSRKVMRAALLGLVMLVALAVVVGAVVEARRVETIRMVQTRTAGSAGLDPTARVVARTFVLTAVARKHLAVAYPLAGPQIRQDITLREWLTGNIPVVPFDVRPTDVERMRVDFAHRDEAQLEVLLGSGDAGMWFVIGLIRRHGHWLVDAWAPSAMLGSPQG